MTKNSNLSGAHAVRLSDRILADHLRTIAEHLVGMSIASPLALGCVAYVMSDVVSGHRVALWLGIVGTAYLMTLAIGILFVRLQPPPTQSRLWVSLFSLRALIAGMSWGISAFLLWPADRFEYQALLLLFLVGVSTVGIMTNAALRRCVLAMFLGIWIPALLQLVRSDDALHHTLAIMIVGFSVIMLASMLRLSRQLVEATRWRFENAALADNLRHEQARAEAANRAKSKFLAAASHDLRQPVHALGFFLQTLRLTAERNDADPRKLVDITRQAQGALAGLTGLLDTLLDVSRLEAGTVPTEVESVALQPVFDTLAQQFTERAARKGLVLHMHATREYARSNPLALQRILSNLVENAVRYTSKGGIAVCCRHRADTLLLQVWDTGSGIPPNELDAIFEEFYQLEPAQGGRERGLGLGLAIVKQLAGLFGHPLSVRSRVGRGSRFSLRVPRADPAQAASALALAPEPSHAHSHHLGPILVIDDDEDSLEAERELLVQSGYRVLAARSADEAVQVVAAQSDRLAAIVADYRLMHNRTGFEAIERVRSAHGRAVPAMIVTGDTHPSRITEIGAGGHLVQHKPLSPEIFLRNVQELIARNV